MNENLKSFLNRIFLVMLIIVAAVSGRYALKLYLDEVDRKTMEIQNGTDQVYITRNNELDENGFYVADLKSELEEFVGNKKISSITYMFEGESFYFDIEVIKSEDGELSFEIDKIANPEFDIKAMMNMKDVESIEYRTGNPTKSSVLKINQKYNTDYFAMMDGNYYFLGNDIESISYRDDHFYYMTYNPAYRPLEEAETCSKEVKNSIDDFSGSHYYYKYGKINFLSDYYQKLASKTFTVQNKCDELATKLEIE